MKINKKTKEKIEKKTYYFSAIKSEFEKSVKKHGSVKEAMNYFSEIMNNAQDAVEEILDKRQRDNLIDDKDQARKSVAGNGFQKLITYALIVAQENNELNKNIVITSASKSHPIISSYAEIKVGEDSQKPDVDLLIYYINDHEILTKKQVSANEDIDTLNRGLLTKPISMYSIKTSLRERAGQSYRWKLLLDIAENSKKLREIYDMEYNSQTTFYYNFITADFYNEVKNPQQKGMIRFFDHAYVTKKSAASPIKTMSNIIKDLNKIYK